MLAIIGSLSAGLTSAGSAFFVFIHGRIVDKFDPFSGDPEAMLKAALFLFYCSCGMCVVIMLTSYIFFTFWVMVSEKISYYYKVRYLEAVIN